MKLRFRYSCILGLALLASTPAQAGMPISEALRRAVDVDREFAAAAATRRAEREAGIQESTDLRPSLSARAGGRYTRADSELPFGAQTGEFPAWSASLEARQALLRFDWFSKLARGTAKEQLAEVHYRNQEIAFIARVTQRYLETMLAEDQVEQIQAEAEAVRQSLEDTRLRYEVELVPGVDLKEAQARDDLVQAQKIAHINQLEAARDALQEVTGYDRGDLPSLKNEIQLPPLEPTHVDDWVEIGMRRNTDVLEARLLAVIAESEVDSKRAQGRPRLDLVASTGRSDSSEYELGSRQDESQIGLELEVPLYGGGRLRSQVRQAQARAEEARIRVQRVEAQSERQLRLAFRDVQAALAADRAYVQVLRSAQAAAKAVDAGYTAGTRTIADVLDAKSSVVNAKRDRNEVRYNLLTKLLGLLLVAGTLSVDDILELDYLFDHSSTNSTAQTTP